MKRRTFIGSLLAASMTGVARARKPDRPRIVVVGAGAFGGWTALHLQRAGAHVTLVDAWGPGHSRASSGGETRVIRFAYRSRIYVDMAVRSAVLWRDASESWRQPLFTPSGVLFLYQEGPGSAFIDEARGHVEHAGIDHERLSVDELGIRYPQIDLEDIAGGLYEPGAGYLLARRACQAVLDAFVREGGAYRIAAVRPGTLSGDAMGPVSLSDGERLAADQYVFACGPWLGALFPDVLGTVLTVSRQEVFYFGYPEGDRRYAAPNLPVWADFGERIWYGIPGAERRGFKIADDTRGPPLDPTDADRTASQAGTSSARAYIARRFPGLRGAPVIESRVCQYTNTRDGDFIIDRHPAASNVWIAGGGSGHGFKHGPALGEMLAGQILGLRDREPAFGLDRFDG
jgi:glycine/D-amino acid oxidase-like deaminating enzyme